MNRHLLGLTIDNGYGMEILSLLCNETVREFWVHREKWSFAAQTIEISKRSSLDRCKIVNQKCEYSEGTNVFLVSIPLKVIPILITWNYFRYKV